MPASPYDPLVRIEGIPAVSGPTSINATLLDNIQATPYEGIWVPWLYTKQGSIEISGSFSSLSASLFGTNSLNPLNSYTITVGGTAATGNTITLTVITPSGTFSVTFNDTTGNTTTQIAAGVVAAIAASTLLSSLGFQATNLANVITLTWPSSPPPGSFPYTTSSPPVAQVVTLTVTASGTASETFAVASGVGGSSLIASITALGMTQFSVSARWLKVRLTTLTGGGANVTAIAQGTA